MPLMPNTQLQKQPFKCKTAKTVDARTTDLSLSFTSLLNKQKNGNEKLNTKINKNYNKLNSIYKLNIRNKNKTR